MKFMSWSISRIIRSIKMLIQTRTISTLMILLMCIKSSERTTTMVDTNTLRMTISREGATLEISKRETTREVVRSTKRIETSRVKAAT